jgi:hypothetical protein
VKGPPPCGPEEEEEEEQEQQEEEEEEEEEEKEKEKEKENSNRLDCIADKVCPGTAVPVGGEGDPQVASSTPPASSSSASSSTTSSSLRMEAFREIDAAISRLICVCGGGLGESAGGGWGGGVGGLRRGGITASARSLECIALR